MCAIHIGVEVRQRHTLGSIKCKWELTGPIYTNGSQWELYIAIVGLQKKEDSRRMIATNHNQCELEECTHRSTDVCGTFHFVVPEELVWP
jgi:hypothetical protein